MILITYWHDNDVDTITSITCNTEEECQKIIDTLMAHGMEILTSEDLPKPTTANELEKMFKEVYEN